MEFRNEKLGRLYKHRNFSDEGVNKVVMAHI